MTFEENNDDIKTKTMNNDKVGKVEEFKCLGPYL